MIFVCSECNYKILNEENSYYYNNNLFCEECFYNRSVCQQCDGSGEGNLDQWKCSKCIGCGSNLSMADMQHIELGYVI